MSAPTISGNEVREGDVVGRDDAPYCCHDDMIVEPFDDGSGWTDFRCSTCGTAMCTDENGVVFDISSSSRM